MLTARLDRFEENLPTVPARIVRLQRTVAGVAYDQIGFGVQTVVDALRNILSSAQVAGRTVTGQSRAAGTDIVANAKRNANQVVGQATAQGRLVASRAGREVTGVVDAAIDAVDSTPGPGKPYEQWTKSELLGRAKELDVEGRHGLDKAQLIAALRRA